MLRQYLIQLYTIYKNQIPKMSFVQHDTEVNRIYFEMFEDVDVPMTGIDSATLTVKRKDGNTYTYGMNENGRDVFIIDGNLVTVILPPSAVYVEGECEAKVSLYDTDYGRLSTQTFKYTVTPDLISDTPIDETNEYPVLVQLINDTNIVVEEFKAIGADGLAAEIILARKGEINLGIKIDKIDEALSNISVNVKIFGAKGDGIADDTQSIKDAMLYVYNNGGGIVYFPKGTYLYSSTLELYSNVTLQGTGDTSILKTNKDNFTYLYYTNPGVIINKNPKLDFTNCDINIKVERLKFIFEINTIDIGSLFRLSGIKDVSFDKCSFEVISPSNKGHNAVIDFYSAWENAKVHNCSFNISSQATVGGCIWIQNKCNSAVISRNALIKDNLFISNAKDELVATYGYLGEVREVTVRDNKFQRISNSQSGSILTAMSNDSYSGGSATYSKLENVKYLDNYIICDIPNCTIDGLIRVGLTADVNSAVNILIDGNTVQAAFSGSGTGITNKKSNRLKITRNTVINTGVKGSTIGINNYSGDTSNTVDNEIVGFNTGIQQGELIALNRITDTTIGISASRNISKNILKTCIGTGIQVVGLGQTIFPVIEGNLVEMLNGDAVACIALTANSFPMANPKVVNNYLYAPKDGTLACKGVTKPGSNSVYKPVVSFNEIYTPALEIDIDCYRERNTFAYDVIDTVRATIPDANFKALIGQIVQSSTPNSLGAMGWIKKEDSTWQKFGALIA